MALLTLPVRTLDVDANIARRAGQIARDLDADDDPAAMLSAIVAATSLEDGASNRVRGRRLLRGDGMRDSGVGDANAVSRLLL